MHVITLCIWIISCNYNLALLLLAQGPVCGVPCPLSRSLSQITMAHKPEHAHLCYYSWRSFNKYNTGRRGSAATSHGVLLHFLLPCHWVNAVTWPCSWPQISWLPGLGTSCQGWSWSPARCALSLCNDVMLGPRTLGHDPHDPQCESPRAPWILCDSNSGSLPRFLFTARWHVLDFLSIVMNIQYYSL